jgi:hypothetical protein
VRPTDDVRLWPEPLRDLVRARGADSVNDAGLHALGYPAVLATSAAEFEAVRNTLKDQRNDFPEHRPDRLQQ